MSTYNAIEKSLYDSEATTPVNEVKTMMYPPPDEGCGWPSGPATTGTSVVMQSIPTWYFDFVACVDPSLIVESALCGYGSNLDLEGIRGTIGVQEGEPSTPTTTTAARSVVPVKRRGGSKKDAERNWLPYRKKPQPQRRGVILMNEDDGSGPILDKDPSGYALPEAALALIKSLDRFKLSTKCFDSVFFPPADKHLQDSTHGHRCQVKMRIVKDEQQKGGGLLWVPVEKECRPQRTGDTYRRHLLEDHLATPRGFLKKGLGYKVKARRRPKRRDE